MSKILKDYVKWSRQKVNSLKYSILFGKFVKIRRRNDLSRLLGFKVVSEMIYLGVKIALKRLVFSNFQNLLEKALSKLNFLGKKFFSLA